mgnify:CR=1 FL=1
MPIPPTLEASFVALATDTTSLIAAERAAWKREDEVLGLQMTAMEETIALLHTSSARGCVEICGGGETLKNRKSLKAYYDSNTQFA